MRRVSLLVLLFFTACGPGPGTGSDAGMDAGGGPDGGGPDGGAGCPRLPAPADRVRKVVVSHPYDSAGAKSDGYEVLELLEDGTLIRPAVTFEMGRSIEGSIAFTPDGEVGMIATEGGFIGVFRFEANGEVSVVHTAFSGSFYAGKIVIAAGGAHAYVLDPNWENNGGGIYRVSIGCDGSLTDEGMVVATRLAHGLAFDPMGQAVLAAKQVDGVASGEDVYLFDWTEPPTLLGGVDSFPDDEQIVSSSALSPNGRHFLVGDNSAFSAVPNRVAVVGLNAGSLSALQTLTPLNDPSAIVFSPFENAALVTSAFGNAAYRLGYDASSTTTPFTLLGEVTYTGARPQLPLGASVLERGSLRGLILVSENLGVRRLRFETDGSVTDLGLTNLGPGSENITGSLGVQD